MTILAAVKRKVFTFRESALEACLIEGIDVFGIDSLAEAVSFLIKTEKLPLSRSDSPYAEICQSLLPGGLF